MKKTLFLTLATLIVLFTGAACTAVDLATMGRPQEFARSPVLDSKPVWRTVVLPTTATSMINLVYGAGLQDYTGMALLQTGSFSLIDRSALNQLLDEQEFSYSGAVDPSTAVELGKLLGAEAVVTINISSIAHDAFWDEEPQQRDATLHLKIISVETSEVLYTGVGRGSDFDGAEGALNTAIQVALIGITN